MPKEKEKSAKPTPAYAHIPPEINTLVQQIVGQMADKWTLLLLEALEEHGTLRFTQLGRLAEGISQKMLTQTLRLMERDGLVTRHKGEADGRVQFVRLTARARALREVAVAEASAVNERALIGLTPQERDLFLELTGRVITALELSDEDQS